MAKLTLNDISNLTGNPTSAETALNANFTAIEEAMENTFSLDGTSPNALQTDLDANSKKIINLPYALTGTEPITLAQATALLTGQDWTGGIGIPAVVFYQDFPPDATAAGQLWVKSSDMSLWIWDGSSWVRQTDPNLQVALNALSVAELDIDDLQSRVIVVEQDTANHTLAISQLVTDTSALAAEQDTLSADIGNLTSVVQTESQARVDGDLALAATINTLQASNALIFIQASAPVAGVGGVPNPIPDGSFWYDSDDGNAQYRWLNGQWNPVDNAEIDALAASIVTEQQARISGDQALAVDVSNLWAQRNADYALINTNNTARINGDAALASSISTLTTSVNNNAAAITTESQARSTADSALSSQISSVSTSVSGLSTTVSQQATSINGIQGKYAIKIDANGYVTGFGLVSTNNNSTPTSTFTVLADNFKIVTPGGSAVTPFYVNGGITYIKNVVIDEAAIGVATIDTLNIKSGAISGITPVTYDFQGNICTATANVWTNLTTSIGTALINVSNITTGSILTLRGYFNAYSASGIASQRGSIRVLRNDGVVLPSILNCKLDVPAQPGPNSYGNVFAWEWVDSAPVSTSHTYTIQVKHFDSNSTGIGRWADIQLVSSVFKR